MFYLMAILKTGWSIAVKEDWLEIKIQAVGRPFGTSAGGFFSGHSSFPPFRFFVWFRKNSVHVWGQTYVLDLIQVFLRCAQAIFMYT